jgi:hypothetical protein
MFQYQHIREVNLYCTVCHTFTQQTVHYVSPSSYTAHGFSCVECASTIGANAQAQEYVRNANRQYDRWGSPPSPNSTYR